MLTVPASAYALGGAVADTQAAPGTPLHVRVTPRRIHLNQAVTVTGVAPASDVGHWAILEQALPQQTWHYVTGARIGLDGRFRLRARPRHSGFLRVVDSAAPAASSGSVSPSWSTSPSGSGGSAPVPVAVDARFSVAQRSLNLLAGNPVVVRGRLMPARAGRWVRLQDRFGDAWRTVARGRTGAAGGFRLRYIPAGGLERSLRVLFAGDRTNARSVLAAGRLTVYGTSVASWYNDAGNTACGFHAGLGVANRSLPCGTRVRFRYGGRSVTATVDDRGPYVGGRDWDLNQSTAAALGFGGVGTVWVTQ